MEGIIYMYTSPSGKKYIGQTTNEKYRRYRFLNQNVNYGGSKINNARKKYGPENFDYKVLIRVESDNQEELKDALNNLEIGLIRMNDTYNNGYNCSTGGGGNSGFSCKHIISEETKRKISKTLTGKTSWNKGIPMSDEHKKKLSEVHKGKPAHNKGKPMSDEQKQKLRKPKKKKG